MDEATILRLSYLAAAVIMVIVAGGVARATVNSKGPWWASVLGAVIAGAILLVAYPLATTNFIWGY
jgi:protein-S-isoprenylcysteine O-methyltransferase Ste14